jgi:hypothetical protein
VVAVVAFAAARGVELPQAAATNMSARAIAPDDAVLAFGRCMRSAYDASTPVGRSHFSGLLRQRDGAPASDSEGHFSMLGRNSYTKEELDHARKGVDQQLAAYKKLVKAIDNATSDPKVTSAREAFEPLFFNNMTVVLDRYFVHRVRNVTGKDGNPLNEVELMADSIMNNDSVLSASKVIKLVPDESVVKVKIGDRIKLTGAQFERLAKAFFAEIEARFR